MALPHRERVLSLGASGQGQSAEAAPWGLGSELSTCDDPPPAPYTRGLSLDRLT